MTEISGVGSKPVYHMSASQSQELSDEQKALEALDKQIKQAVKEETVDEFKKTVEDTQKNQKAEMMQTLVKAALCGAGVFLTLAPITRRATAKLGAPVIKTLITGLEKVGNKFPKLSFDGAKAKELIDKAASELKNGNSEKIVNWVKTNVGDILGPHTKLKNIPFISNISKDVQIIDAGIATAVGYQAMQPDSENTNKIINAANNVLIAC